MSVFPVVWSPVEAVTAGLNVACAIGASFGAGYWAHRLPATRLADDGFVLRIRSFEVDGRCYERRLGIRRWKDRLPEAGAFFPGGTSKRRLLGNDPEALGRFTIETRRAEKAHWAALVAVCLLPPLWNGWPGAVLMVVYGVAVNAPCIAVQRFNRARLIRLSRRRTGPP